MKYLTGLLLFQRERFPLPNFLAGYLMGLGGFWALGLAAGVGWWQCLVAGFLYSVFLFRLRVQDDLKDLATDIRVHPERPIARGDLSPRAAGLTALGLVLIEASMSFWLGFQAGLVWVALGVFSFLMYKEFFIKSFIEKSLLAAAVLHSPSTILAGFWMVNLAGHGLEILLSPWIFYGLSLMVSAINYDVSRKTFFDDSVDTERSSYSRRWGFLFCLRWSVGLMLLQASLGSLYLFGQGAPFWAQLVWAIFSGTLALLLWIFPKQKLLHALGGIGFILPQVPVLILGVLK